MSKSTLCALQAQHEPRISSDTDKLPLIWQHRHEALERFIRGPGSAAKGLRNTGKPAICYVLIGWLIEDWKREYDKEPSLDEIAATIGTIKRSPAQNLRNRVRGFLVPGGIWNPSTSGTAVSGKKVAAVSGKSRKIGARKGLGSLYADSDFIHSLWRSRWFARTDRVAISVVSTNRRYLFAGLKRPPIDLCTSPKHEGPKPPPQRFSDMDLPHQAIFAYDPMVRTWEGKRVDDLEYGIYRANVKIHADMQARMLRSPNALPAVVKGFRNAYRNECARRRMKPMPIDFIFGLEEEAGLHIHGPIAMPITHKAIVDHALKIATGKWSDPDGRRGCYPVRMERAPTTRGVGYCLKHANDGSRSFNGPAIVISRNLRKIAGEAYKGAVAHVLEYRKTGKKLITTTPKTEAERGRDREFWRKSRRHRHRMPDDEDPEWRELDRELAAMKRAKTAAGPSGPARGPSGPPLVSLTAAAKTGDLSAAITAERATIH